MLDQSKVIVNNMEKGQRGNPLKVRGWDQSFVDILMPVSSNDRGGESAKDGIL
jgi:hypothetical protein